MTSPGGRLVVRLPTGLATKAALLDAYATALAAPWPPGTWDGLYDLLQGLWWIDAAEVEIGHADVPLGEAPVRDRAIYRTLVEDVHQAWAERAGARDWLPGGASATIRRTVRITVPPESHGDAP